MNSYNTGLNRLFVINISQVTNNMEFYKINNITIILIFVCQRNFTCDRKTQVDSLVCSMVFNATFNNISVISWRSVLLVKETGEPGENHQPVTSH